MYILIIPPNQLIMANQDKKLYLRVCYSGISSSVTLSYLLTHACLRMENSSGSSGCCMLI